MPLADDVIKCQLKPVTRAGYPGVTSGQLAQIREIFPDGVCDYSKDAAGDVEAVELENHDDVALFNALEGEVGGLISEEDIEYAAADLEPNSSAALLVWEDVWATPFVEAMRNSGAVLIEGSRIPHDLIEAAEAELAAAG
jgi:hypothetical protein